MILGIPTGGNIKGGYFDSVTRDIKSGIITDWIRAESIYLDINRNNIVANFLLNFPEEKVLAQIDDDIYWDAMVIPHLLPLLEEHEVVFPDLSLGDGPTTAMRWAENKFIPHWPHTIAPFACDGVAGAFFIARREIYELIPKGEWFDRRMINGTRAGEDLSFSLRLKEMGIKPWCVPGLPLLHFRTTPILSRLITINNGDKV